MFALFGFSRTCLTGSFYRGSAERLDHSDPETDPQAATHRCAAMSTNAVPHVWSLLWKVRTRRIIHSKFPSHGGSDVHAFQRHSETLRKVEDCRLLGRRSAGCPSGCSTVTREERWTRAFGRRGGENSGWSSEEDVGLTALSWNRQRSGEDGRGVL